MADIVGAIAERIEATLAYAEKALGDAPLVSICNERPTVDIIAADAAAYVRDGWSECFPRVPDVTAAALAAEVRPHIATLARIRAETLQAGAQALIADADARRRILDDPQTAQSWPCVSQGDGHPAWQPLRTLRTLAAHPDAQPLGCWPRSANSEDVAAWIAEHAPGEWGARQKELAQGEPTAIATAVLNVPSGDDIEVLSADDLANLFAAYLRAMGTQSFRAPVSLLTGPNSVAPLFGRNGNGRRIVPMGKSRDGTISKVSVRRRNDGPQLELFTEHIGLRSATQEETFALVSKITSNSEFRLLLACFAAGQDDTLADRTLPGGFWYTPARIARMMGYATAPRTTQRIDRMMRSLRSVSVKATIEVSGERFTLDGPLIYYAHGTLTDERRPGRPRAQLWRVSDTLLKITDAGSGYYCPLPTRALRPPDGVDQRTWDDAFKLFAVLSAHARVNARDARGNTRWRRKLDELCIECGLESPVATDLSRADKARRHRDEHRQKCLAALATAGLLAYRRSVNRRGAEVLDFDLPEQRGQLASIRPKRQTRRRPKGKTPSRAPV